ncbi:MAG: site-specific integrase [Lachnospiraceae bacterium]|nr:site-specific integrase [Lachnospiraceae bacterium]
MEEIQKKPENTQELLNYLSSQYKIDLDAVQSELDMLKNTKYREMHTGAIWEGKNHKWYTYIGEDRKTRKLVKRNSEEDLEEFLTEYYKSLVETPTFEMVFHKFIERKKERGEIRLSSYDRYINQFKKYFLKNEKAKKLINKKVSFIDADDLDECLYPSIKALNMSSKEFNAMCGIVRGVMKYAVQKRYSSFNVTTYLDSFDRPKNGFRSTKKSPKEESFSISETNLLLEYLLKEGDVRSLGLVLLFETGLRVGELAALKKSDVNDDLISVTRTEIHYKNEATGKNKIDIEDFTKTDAGERQVTVRELGKAVLAQLLARNPESEWLLTDDDGKRICESGFRRKIYRACDAVGIPRRSPHKIRKTYATNLIYSGVNEEVVKYLMGHSDISTTRRSYVIARADMNFIREQLAKAPVLTKVSTSPTAAQTA